MDINVTPGPRCQRYLFGFDLRRKPHLEADVLVVGSGGAGCAAALAAARAGCEVLLLCKAPLMETNTRYAQGGIAAVLDDHEREHGDTIQAHLDDTLTAGVGLCDREATADILTGGAEVVAFLREIDCQFDTEADGHVALTREGGHHHRRILHALGDRTGHEISRALTAAVLAEPLITVLENTFAIDLLTDDLGVRGALYQRRAEICAALAGRTVLATGGLGRVFRETTNPATATGDGLAMAYRAGARVADCEFVQFHPTTLYLAGGPRLLITEAMRGEGAVIKNQEGERFMDRYHPDGELAPRDVVSRAIVAEIQDTGHPHVWLDATHLGGAFLRERFPTIYRALKRYDIDISRDWIPVHPSAHYHCGGVYTDTHGRTTTPGLLACGEVACTGLHGANRLASNSILEALVVGLRSGRLAAAEGGFPGRVRIKREHYPPIPEDLDTADLTRSLRALMWRHVGIVREAKGLDLAQRSLAFWSRHQTRGAFNDEDGWQLQNSLLVGRLITAGAAGRSASVGTHLRADSQGPIDTAHRAFDRPEEEE